MKAYFVARCTNRKGHLRSHQANRTHIHTYIYQRIASNRYVHMYACALHAFYSCLPITIVAVVVLYFFCLLYFCYCMQFSRCVVDLYVCFSVCLFVCLPVGLFRLQSFRSAQLSVCHWLVVFTYAVCVGVAENSKQQQCIKNENNNFLIALHATTTSSQKKLNGEKCIVCGTKWRLGLWTYELACPYFVCCEEKEK